MGKTILPGVDHNDDGSHGIRGSRNLGLVGCVKIHNSCRIRQKKRSLKFHTPNQTFENLNASKFMLYFTKMN